MPDDAINRYSMSAADWRKTIRQNNFRTYIIIGLFILIYASIGILVDMYLYLSTYPNANLQQLLISLLSFKLFPLVTLIMLGVAIISILVTYHFYDKLMLLGTDYHEITPETANTIQEKQLYNTVEEMKIAAGLRYMPRVFIIHADYMNAFASGYSEKSAMVAITTGLLTKLNRDEIQAVMAHELSHIRHLDIKLTLTASLLANLTIMILDMLFYNIIFKRQRQDNKNYLATIIIILRYTLPIISAILLLYLSRTRELMADAGCVELMRTNQPLATALLKIHADYTTHREQYATQQTAHENVRREAYLYDPNEVGIKSFASIGDLFSTHPSLETRLKALGYQQKP